MFRTLIIIALASMIHSCTNNTTDTCKTEDHKSPKTEMVSDSSPHVISEYLEKAHLPSPFDITQLEHMDGLQFTSTIAPKEDGRSYCSDEKNGFYGHYTVIKNGSREHADHIHVYKPGKMADWKASDTNQTIWKISLTTDVIGVWDSVHVGQSRKFISNFATNNNGLCINKGETYSSCNFNNFTLTCNFEADKVTRLVVTRNCHEKKERPR